MAKGNILSSIGRTVMNTFHNTPAQAVQPTQPATPAQAQQPATNTAAGQTTTIQQTIQQPLTTTNMSLDELKARRMARVEAATGLVEPMHVKVMLRFVDGVCTIVPFAIILLTTSELGQLFTGKPFNIADQTSLNMYGAALMAESVFGACTFIWQYALTYLNSLSSEQERSRMEAFTKGLGLTWGLFALISALGQFVYLRSIWHPANTDFFVYTLIVARVAMFVGSDWACAKYLGWRIHTLKRIAQEEKAKGEIYEEIEQQEASRMQKEAEADAHMRQIKINAETAVRNARMATEVQEIMSKSATKFLEQFMGTLDNVMNGVLENVNARLESPDIEGEVKVLKQEEEDI